MKQIVAIGTVLFAALAPGIASALEFEQHGNGGTIYHITDQNRAEAISAATQYCKDHDRVVQIRYVTAGVETEMVFVCNLPS